jgi:DNA-binding MarR family transcriptional regulator
MSQDSESENRATQMIVEAGEILQKLTPPRIATLLFGADDEIETQGEIADILGCSPSTISTYYQTLEGLPLSLAAKGRTHYTITDNGEDVLDLLDEMLDHLGVDLVTLNWDEDASEQIGECLAPLHGSRNTIPFFVLHSLGTRSTVGERIDRHGTPEPVRIKDIVADVNLRQQDRGKTATRKQVRWMLGRFEDFGGLEFDGKEAVKLTDQGQEQAVLLEELLQLLTDDGDEETTTTSQTHTQQNRATRSDAMIDLAQQLNRTDVSELSGRTQYGGSQLPTVVPAYCLASPSDKEAGEDDTHSPVFPIPPTTTVDELTEHINRLAELDGDVSLELNWAVWIESGLYPVGAIADEENADENDEKSTEQTELPL